METSCIASGARRSRAAVAVVNSLGAVDLVAAIVAEDAQAVVADAVRKELQAQDCVRIFDLGRSPVPEVPTPGEAAESPRHREVYLWGGVDAAIAEDPEGFEHTVEALCSSLVATEGSGRKGHGIRRAVIIGGDALLERLDHLVHGIQRGVRYRYILVQ